MKDLEQELHRVADDVIKLVAKKNYQYGDAYFKLRDEMNGYDNAKTIHKDEVYLRHLRMLNK